MIAHPTDARLCETARRKLVARAAEAGIELCQSHARPAPRLAAKAGRHAHARQFKRMRKALRTLKGDTGRVMRDLHRPGSRTSRTGPCASASSTCRS